MSLGPGRFRLLSFHARGGLGEVLLAEDTELNRPVALKRILDDAAADPEARRRFVLEAEITSRLEHPGVVPVYGLGADPATGRPYYAMRFITGKPLKTVIDEFHASAVGFDGVAFRKLLGSVVSVCQTVGYAHGQGVLHRDLKPANVMVGAHGETLVVDWGIAKVLGEAEPARPPSVPTAAEPDGSTRTATQTGSALGTPGYMSPEQARGDLEQLGPATDIYALGATLYHVLCGAPPLGDKPAHARVMLTIQGRVPSVRTLRPTVPTALSAICAKAMAAVPSQRYARAQELASDLERWLADEPVSCVREGPLTVGKRWLRRHPTTVATSLAATLLLGLAAVGLAAQNAEIAEQRDRAVTAERVAAEQRDRAVEAERTAAAQRDRAVTAERTAVHEREEARRVVADCLDVARYSSAFLQPGTQEARELLLRKAVPYHERWAQQTGSRELRTEAVVAKFEAAFASAETVSKSTAAELYGRCIAELSGLAREHPRTAEFRQQLAKAHHNLGLLLLNGGDAVGGRRSMLTAETLQKQLAAESPAEPTFRADLARTAVGLGFVEQSLGRHASAVSAYRAALPVQERLAAEHPANPQFRRDLGSTYHHLAVAQRALGEPTARATAQRALELRAQLVAESPRATAFRSELADTQLTLAPMLRDAGDAAGARAAFGSAAETLEALVAENPAVTGFQVRLAVCSYNFGFSLLQQDDAASGLPRLTRAVELSEGVLAREPSNEPARLVALSGHWARANALGKLGRHAEAVADWKRADELNRDPSVDTYKRGLAEAAAKVGR